MKNIFLFFSLMLIAGMGYSQVKVVTSGDVKVGDQTNSPAATLHITGKSPGLNSELLRVDASNGGGYFSALNGSSGPFVPSFRFNSQLNGIAGSFTAAVSTDINSFAIGGAMNIDARTETNNPLVNAKLFVVRNHATPHFTIAANGNVGIGPDYVNPPQKLSVNGNISATGTVTPSDKRLKSNIKKLSKGLNEVLELKTVSYDYNGKAGVEKGFHFGLIAQELQEIVPELVGEFEVEYLSDYSKYEDLSNKIDPKDIVGEKMHFIKESEIKYLLINAIQEQQEIIESQDEKITKLESLIEEISSKIDSGSFGLNQTDVTLSDVSYAELEQNVPNPFFGKTSVQYTIPSGSKNAKFNVFSLNGKLMKTIMIDHVGLGSININAFDLPSGTYTYNLTVDGTVVGSKKMVVTQ